MSRPAPAATATASGGVGFGGALALLFIAFRLAGIIDWPWRWVLAPVWIPAGLVLLIAVSVGVLYVLFTIAAAVAARDARERRRAATGAPAASEHGPAHRRRSRR